MLKELFNKRYNALFLKGLNDGMIVPFKNLPELYEEMSNTYINAFPVSMHIKYLRPVLPPGMCYDRSLYMFFSMKDSILVRGDLKMLEYNVDKESAGHGWVERGEYVYDPTYLCRFDKKLYYKMNKISNVTKTSMEEYLNLNNNRKFYENLKSKTIDDFKPNGRYRHETLDLFLIKGIADNSKDKQFKNDVYAYLNEIEYDSISKDLEERNSKILKQKN